MGFWDGLLGGLKTMGSGVLKGLDYVAIQGPYERSMLSQYGPHWKEEYKRHLEDVEWQNWMRERTRQRAPLEDQQLRQNVQSNQERLDYQAEYDREFGRQNMPNRGPHDKTLLEATPGIRSEDGQNQQGDELQFVAPYEGMFDPPGSNDIWTEKNQLATKEMLKGQTAHMADPASEHRPKTLREQGRHARAKLDARQDMVKGEHDELKNKYETEEYQYMLSEAGKQEIGDQKLRKRYDEELDRMIKEQRLKDMYEKASGSPKDLKARKAQIYKYFQDNAASIESHVTKMADNAFNDFSQMVPAPDPMNPDPDHIAMYNESLNSANKARRAAQVDGLMKNMDGALPMSIRNKILGGEPLEEVEMYVVRDWLMYFDKHNITGQIVKNYYMRDEGNMTARLLMRLQELTQDGTYNFDTVKPYDEYGEK